MNKIQAYNSNVIIFDIPILQTAHTALAHLQKRTKSLVARSSARGSWALQRCRSASEHAPASTKATHWVTSSCADHLAKTIG